MKHPDAGTAQGLIDDIRRRGGRLILDGERVRCRGPGTLLTPGLVASLAQHKAEIVATLRREEAESPLLSLQDAPIEVREKSEIRPQSSDDETLTAICGKARSWPHAFSLLLDARGVPNGGKIGDDFFDALDALHAQWDATLGRRPEDRPISEDHPQTKKGT